MQGLIIAFIIISFIYKTYKNFTKESEKAAQRTKDAEEIQKAAERAKAAEYGEKTKYERITEQKPFVTAYDKAVVEDYIPTTVFENSKDFYKEEKAKPKESRPARSLKQAPADYYNPEVPASEVLANRRIHEPHKHGVKLPKKEKHVAADFNFRQALIYDAILRRPEY